MEKIAVGTKTHVWALSKSSRLPGGARGGIPYMWDGTSWANKSGGTAAIVSPTAGTPGIQLSQISVGIDGTVKGINLAGNLVSWTGTSWGVLPYKLHYVDVVNKDMHWAISKEATGIFNVYQSDPSGYYIPRAKNLQQVSVNSTGTFFGITLLTTSGGFKVYAKIVKLTETIINQILNAKTKTTVKEKIETLQSAFNTATPEKMATISTANITRIQTEFYNQIYVLLTTELEKVKTENQLAALKKLIDDSTTPTSKVIAENIKLLLKAYADGKIKVEEPTPEPEIVTPEEEEAPTVITPPTRPAIPGRPGALGVRPGAPGIRPTAPGARYR